MNKLKIIFLSIFISILCIPVIFFDFKSEKSLQEKKILAKMPALFNKGSLRPNFKFFKQFDKYLGDRFGLRSFLVSLNANVKHNIFKKIGNKQALIGKNGWLYYIPQEDGKNLDDIMKINLLDKKQLGKVVTAIQNRTKWCEENNIKFIMLICPNKHNVYPENFPYKIPDGTTKREQITAELQKLGVNFIDPTEYLLKMKKDISLYQEKDSHWNGLGAYYTFLLLKEKVEELFPKVTIPSYDFDMKIEKTYEGDLIAILGFNKYGYSTEVVFTPKGISWSDIFTEKILPKKVGSKQDMITTSSKGAPIKAVIFRDSFFIHLEPFVSSCFSNLYYKWKIMDESDKEFIIREKPDLVIFEVIERWLPSLAEDDKKF